MNSITSRSATEVLLHEKFQALLTELDTVGDNAVLDEMDDFLFTTIRQLAAETLEKKSKIVSTHPNKSPLQNNVPIVITCPIPSCRSLVWTTFHIRGATLYSNQRKHAQKG